LETDNWRAYERNEKSNGVRLVLSMDSKSIAVLEKLSWRPFIGIGRATFSLLGVKAEGEN
jgi:hypothetical protein